MSIWALFSNRKIRSNLMSPVGESMNKPCSFHKIKCYITVKNNRLVLRNVIQSEKRNF